MDGGRALIGFLPPLALVLLLLGLPTPVGCADLPDDTRVAEARLPAGTILPVELKSSVSAAKAKRGDRIKAALAQSVRLEDGRTLPLRATLIGRVLEAESQGKDGGSKLTLTFDRLLLPKHHEVFLEVGLRALASAAEVEDAQLPDSGPDRGTPQFAWTTVQVGGDVVYRGGGHVVNVRGETVGDPVPDGVLVHLGPCRARRDNTPNDNALRPAWIFSSGACGVYGSPDMTISHAGYTDPKGEIALTATERPIFLRGGTGLLLRVN